MKRDEFAIQFMGGDVWLVHAQVDEEPYPREHYCSSFEECIKLIVNNYGAYPIINLDWR